VFSVGATHVKLAVPLPGGVAEVTFTVALCATEPAEFEQLSVYVVPVVRAAVEREPLVPSAPDQPPDAVQAVAFVEDQVRRAVLPLVTLVGLALKVTLGSPAETVTVADCEA
jgi:hypothetical protein